MCKHNNQVLDSQECEEGPCLTALECTPLSDSLAGGLGGACWCGAAHKPELASKLSRQPELLKGLCRLCRLLRQGLLPPSKVWLGAREKVTLLRLALALALAPVCVCACVCVCVCVCVCARVPVW